MSSPVTQLSSPSTRCRPIHTNCAPASSASAVTFASSSASDMTTRCPPLSSQSAFASSQLQSDTTISYVGSGVAVGVGEGVGSVVGVTVGSAVSTTPTGCVSNGGVGLVTVSPPSPGRKNFTASAAITMTAQIASTISTGLMFRFGRASFSLIARSSKSLSTLYSGRGPVGLGGSTGFTGGSSTFGRFGSAFGGSGSGIFSGFGSGIGSGSSSSGSRCARIPAIVRSTSLSSRSGLPNISIAFASPSPTQGRRASASSFVSLYRAAASKRRHFSMTGPSVSPAAAGICISSPFILRRRAEARSSFVMFSGAFLKKGSSPPLTPA